MIYNQQLVVYKNDVLIMIFNTYAMIETTHPWLSNQEHAGYLEVPDCHCQCTILLQDILMKVNLVGI